jgi:hypothetical protein
MDPGTKPKHPYSQVEPPEGDHIRGRPPLPNSPDGAHSSYFGQLKPGPHPRRHHRRIAARPADAMHTRDSDAAVRELARYFDEVHAMWRSGAYDGSRTPAPVSPGTAAAPSSGAGRR